jgi:AcrR family transcriptional regulator
MTELGTEAPHVGLRERKKQQTRLHIANTARRLFGDRGFDAVTVGEVARAADVSEKTVFNYFPTKEDLFYSGMEAFEEQLLGAIRDRDPGESALDAFGRFLLVQRGLLGRQDPEARERLAMITRMIAESPALIAREQQIFARYTDSLAALLADELGADAPDARPWVAANAMMGVHRAVVDYARRRVMEGARHPALSREVRRRAEQALAQLRDGLSDYAVKTS